jgi:uncharacterized protein YsxB (DUF464 family)
MIVVEVTLDTAGLLQSCKAQGHAGQGPTGGDIVCAAVSVLMRTAARTLDGRSDISIRWSAVKRGDFLLEVEYRAEGAAFLAGAGAFLVAGLVSVAEEFPQNCKVHTFCERRQ